MPLPLIGWFLGLAGTVGSYANATVNHMNGNKGREHGEKLQRESIEAQEKERRKDRELQARLHRESLAAQEENARLNRQSQEAERRKDRELQARLHQETIQAQAKLAELQRQTALMAARMQCEATLQIPELNRKYADWMLRTVPSDLLNSHRAEEKPPLRIMPVFQGLESVGDLHELPTNLLQGCYARSGDRPVEVLDQNWKPEIPFGGGTLKTLFSTIGSEPCLFLAVKQNKGNLSFRIAYWGFDAPFPYDHIVISEAKSAELRRYFAKKAALAWEQERQGYLEMGLADSLEALDKLYKQDQAAHNLKVMAMQTEQEAKGADASRFDNAIVTDDADVEAAAKAIANCSALLGAFFTDMHYLVYDNLPPKFPQLLPQLTADMEDLALLQDILREVLQGYREILKELKAGGRSALVPELALSVGTALAAINGAESRQLLDYALASWLTVRTGDEVTESQGHQGNLLKAAVELMAESDLEFLQGLRSAYESLGDSLATGYLQEYEDRLQEQRLLGRVGNAHPTYGKSFVEDLGNGVTLEMVLIPAGSFMMGSPVNEESRGSDEGPQHLVEIAEPFYMGRFLVTQAQWQQIMGDNPSYFKHDDEAQKYPVESVSWDRCKEFFVKLNKTTGKTYRLPSEAEWEYACRAGEPTPFYFGETLSTDIANYDGKYIYGSGKKGQYRRETTPVENFKANGFGLYDMHGNLWEWCEDDYVDNYSTPRTQKPYKNTTSKYKVLRGGSWADAPRNCRSANRGRYNPALSDSSRGFRVVCVGSSSP